MGHGGESYGGESYGDVGHGGESYGGESYGDVGHDSVESGAQQSGVLRGEVQCEHKIELFHKHVFEQGNDLHFLNMTSRLQRTEEKIL